jgi:hypothetical protein
MIEMESQCPTHTMPVFLSMLYFETFPK